MKEKLKEINPGAGLGELKFGQSFDEVRTLLGDPSEMEEPDEDLDNTIWHYDELELSLAFEQNETWELSVISVTSSYYTYNGHPFIGLDTSSVTKLLNSLDIDDVEADEIELADGKQELLAVDSLGIVFWLENGLINEVQCSSYE